MDPLLISAGLFGILIVIKILTSLNSSSSFVGEVVSGTRKIIDACCGSHRRDFR